MIQSLYYSPASRYIESADRGRSIIQVTVGTAHNQYYSQSKIKGLTLAMGKLYCSATNCHNYSGKCANDRKISLHRFPVNKRLSMLWKNRISRKNWKPTSCSRLCSEHFITKVGPTKEHPIPSIFDHKIFKTTNVSVMYLL